MAERKARTISQRLQIVTEPEPKAPKSLASQRQRAELLVPMLPGRACSPNGGHHWKTRMRDRRELRECARLAALSLLSADNGPLREFVGYEGQITLDVEIRWCCGRKTMDDDNAKASLKALVDGLADILFSGDDRCVEMGSVTQKRGDGSVTVTLRMNDGV